MAAKKKTATGPKNPLDRIITSYKQKQTASSTSNLASLDLMDFLVAASPHLSKPMHLAPVLPYLYAIEKSPQFFAYSAPPRHGKSVLMNHFVAWMMIRHPGICIAYGCYGEKLSFFFSDEVKDILTTNGYEVDRSRNSRNEWRLTNGSLFKAVSPGSDFTGRGADLIIIDDPYKNRVTASSGAVRESTWNWFTGVAITRRSPECSVIVTHTRWAVEDIIGTIAGDPHNKTFINMPALNDKGEALWPEQWPVERLLETKAIIGEYDWASLYMGSPRPLGGAVFNQCATYTDEELDALSSPDNLVKLVRYEIGIDLAYTKKAHADYSVAVVLAILDNKKAYVVDVRRDQCDTTSFAKTLRELRMAYDNAPIRWYVGGQEKVIAETFRNTHRVPVKDIPAKEDKFARAQAVAAAWNAGRVLIPSDIAKRPWVSKFLEEILSFTGLDDPHDDQVDALAAAWVTQAKPPVARHRTDDPRFAMW